MRARNIKPGFFTNDQILECEPLARLLFAGLWGMADRKGRLEDRPKKIRIQVLPCDNCDIDALLEQLRQQDLIHRYEASGQHYIQVINFEKHQHPHHKEPGSLIPAPDSDAMLGASMMQQPRAGPGQTSEPPVANPSDSLIPDSLIPESSLNSDDMQARERRPRKAGRKPSDRIRLTCDTLPPEWAQWAHAEMGWSDQAIQDVWAYFRDYWRGRTDKGAQKSDWEATWRVWCRKQNIHSGGKYGQSKVAGSHHPRFNQPNKSERARAAIVESAIELGYAAPIDARREGES